MCHVYAHTQTQLIASSPEELKPLPGLGWPSYAFRMNCAHLPEPRRLGKMLTDKGPYTRFPSSPLEIRVPFFLLFGFTKGTPKKRDKRVLLGNLVYGYICFRGVCRALAVDYIAIFLGCWDRFTILHPNI